MDSLDIYTTVVLELAFVLAIVCVVLISLVKKFSQANRRLRQKLSRLQKSQQNLTKSSNILNYLERQVDSTERHRQRTSAGTSAAARSATSPLVAIADFREWELRNAYLRAEIAAYHATEGSSSYWQELETALRRILTRLSVPRQQSQELAHWRNKVEILRQRVSKLKGFEQRCQQAESELVTVKTKVEKLQRLGDVSQVNRQHINRITELNRRLGEASGGTVIVTRSGEDSGLTCVSGGHQSNANVVTRQEENADFVLDKVTQQRRTILDLREKIRNYELQLEKVRLQNEKLPADSSLMEKISQMEKELVGAERSANELAKEVKTLKRALADADGQVMTATLGGTSSEQTEFWRQAKQQKEDGAYQVLQIKDREQPAVNLDDDALARAREAYRRAVKDVDHLREVTQGQRRMILELESELQRLRQQVHDSDPDDSDLAEKKEALDNFEKLYRESELCVAVLESEVEQLQTRLQDMAQDLREDEKYLEDNERVTAVAPETESTTDAAAEDSRVEALQQELQQMTDMLNNTMAEYGDQSCVTRFATMCLQYRDLTDLVNELMAIIKQLGLIGAVQVRSELGDIESAEAGQISAHDKANMKSIQYNGRDRVTRVKGGFVVTFHNISSFVKEPPGPVEGHTRFQDILTSLLSVASFAIEKIEHGTIRDRQKKNLDALIHSVDKGLANVEVQYKYQTEEAHNVVNRLLKELYSCLTTMDLTETQSSIFKEMMEDCQERMALLFASGLTVDESMQKILNKLRNY